jgi:hypothetical protein
MKHLINCQWLASSDDKQGKTVPISILNIHSILKKAALIVFALILSFGISYAQDDSMMGKRDITNKLRSNHQRNTIDEVNKIPVATRNEFYADFSNVQDVIWKVEPGFNEADFTMDNKSMMAFFNYDDELIGSGYYVDYADLPEKGRERIAKDYGDYIPEKAMFFHDNEENDSDYLNFFGNFLKEEAYFVLLRKDAKEIVVQVDEDGEVSYFSSVRSR